MHRLAVDPMAILRMHLYFLTTDFYLRREDLIVVGQLNCGKLAYKSYTSTHFVAVNAGLINILV